jgi:hypothetical protein
MIDDGSTLSAPIGTGTGRVSTLDQLASIREEEIRSSKQKSAHPRLPARRPALHAHLVDH